MALAKCLQCGGFYDAQPLMHPTENRPLGVGQMFGRCPRCTEQPGPIDLNHLYAIPHDDDIPHG